MGYFRARSLANGLRGHGADLSVSFPRTIFIKIALHFNLDAARLSKEVSQFLSQDDLKNYFSVHTPMFILLRPNFYKLTGKERIRNWTKNFLTPMKQI